MTNIEINEAMVQDIANFLKEYNVFTGTSFFYNNKLMSYEHEKKEVVIKENVNVTEYSEFCNPDMVTLLFEYDDSPFEALSWYFKGEGEETEKGNKIIMGLSEIGIKYNRKSEFGTETCLYYRPDDGELGITLEEFKKYHFPKNED